MKLKFWKIHFYLRKYENEFSHVEGTSYFAVPVFWQGLKGTMQSLQFDLVYPGVLIHQWLVLIMWLFFFVLL